MNRNLILALGMMLLCTAPALHAQVRNEGLANTIIAARQKNAQLMQQFSWNCRIEIQEHGIVKDTRIEQCVYGPDNKIQRTLLNDTGSPLPHGFLRKKIAEKEREEMSEYLKQIVTMLDQYTLPSAGAVINFISKSPIPPPGPNGELQLSGGSVVAPGDTMSLWIQASTRAISKVTIITADSASNQVSLTATFKTLAGGLNYMQYATVDIPAKGLSIQVHNYDYISQNN